MLVNLEEQLEFNQLSTFEMGLKMSLLGLDFFNRGILGVKIEGSKSWDLAMGAAQLNSFSK